MSERTLKSIERAVRAHIKAEYGEQVKVSDWIVSISTKPESGLWRNRYVCNSDSNPNTHIALSAWASDEIKAVMHRSGDVGERQSDTRKPVIHFGSA